MQMKMNQIMNQVFQSTAEQYVEDMLQEYPILQRELATEKANTTEQKVEIIRDRLSRLQTDWDKRFVANTPYFVEVDYQCPISGTYRNKVKVSKFHFLLVRNYICQRHSELRGFYPDSRDTYKMTCKVLGAWWRCKLSKEKQKQKQINLTYLNGHIQSVI
jgi:NAD-specific glutamate dehydrogenase